MAQTDMTIDKQASPRSKWRAWLVPVMLLFLSLLYALLILLLRGNPVVMALAIIPFLLVILFIRPRYALYMVIGLSLAADTNLLPWMQFDRGVSEISRHTLQWLILSPLEITLLIAFVGQIVRMTTQGLRLKPGIFLWAMMPFYCFVVLGLISGLAQGGNMHIALWEARSLFYIPIIYLVFLNSVQTKEQFRIATWIVLLAVGIDCIIGTWNYLVVLQGNLGDLRAGTDHVLAIFINLLFLVIAGYILFGGIKKQKQWWYALVMMPFAMITLVSANRRSGWLALAIALVLLFLLAFWQNRGRTLRIAAVAVVVGSIYVGAFWNSSNFLAKPLQSFRSINAEEGSLDYGSNLYREMEKWDILYTMRQSPILGVGFGGKFLQPIPLAYYDSPFREYITHNSFAWIWLKTGGFGFVAFLIFIGFVLMQATRILRKIDDSEIKVPLCCGILFITMYLIYCYLDQGWDAKGAVYLGTVLGMFAVAKQFLDNKNNQETVEASPVDYDKGKTLGLSETK